MKDALELLNKNIYKCPTDTEKVLVYNDGIYEKAKPLIWKILEEKYGEQLKKQFVEEAYAHLQRANIIDREEINKFTNKIPIKDGLFNLLTRETEPFDPKQVFTYKLEPKFNPETKCQKWLEFINQILEKDNIPLLQEIMGYCLLPDMPFHKIFWFYGTGRNGKGVVIRTLEAILNKENCSNLNLSEFTENRRFSLQKLYSKFLNVSSEPKLTKYGLQTTVLKMVTGQDTIDAEIKGKNERLKFVNHAKMIVIGNHFPKVDDNSLGWRERCVILNFPNQFIGEKEIQNIEENWVPEELDGIFNWMLDGLYRLWANRKFSSSKSTEEMTIEFMKVSDPFNAWILERCVFVPNAYLTREEALTDYQHYCDELEADRDNKRVFYEKMRITPRIKDIQKKIKGKNEHVFEGITFKKEDQNQTILNEVAKVAKVAIPHIGVGTENSNSKLVQKPATFATSATNEDNSDGFVVQCFNCRKVLAKHEVYSWGGNVFCRECRLGVEEQKRSEDRWAVDYEEKNNE